MEVRLVADHRAACDRVGLGVRRELSDDRAGESVISGRVRRRRPPRPALTAPSPALPASWSFEGLGERGAGGFLVTDRAVGDVRGDQRLGREVVHLAGKAAGELVDQADRVAGEQGVGAVGELQMVRDVIAGLLEVLPVNQIAQRDPLIQRREHGLPQPRTQRWLAEQHARKLARVHLRVDGHPQLLELLGAQQVTFVQDEHDAAAALCFLGLEHLLAISDQRRGVKPRDVATPG